MKIRHLKLNCANLDEQRYFYTKKFKFKLVEDGREEISLEIGNSLLTFTENKLKKSYYHFAFNIPYNFVEKALSWVKKKVDVIATEDGDIQEFTSWNARSIYFLDPAGNIVEFIGRKNFNDSNGSAFSESKILNLSEVGLPVFEVQTAYKLIKSAGVKKFDCESNVFCAAGDDEGLFIIVDKAEKTWYPTDEPAKPFNLEVNFGEGDESYCLSFYSGEMNISKIEKETTESS